MLSALARAFSDIRASIPKVILEMAFNPTASSTVSLETAIMQEVILPRVKDAVSVRGGRISEIILNQDWSHFTPSPSTYAVGQGGTFSTYVVPPEARENRDITNILGINLTSRMNVGVGYLALGNALDRGVTMPVLANRALRAQMGTDAPILPTPILRDGSTIVLDPPQHTFIPWAVTVRLDYDENFSNMPSPLLEPFSDVVVWAVKAYIHTNLTILIDSNAVFRGADIGVIKSIVESYSEANEKYKEALEKMGGAEVYDPSRTMRLLRRILST